MSTGTDRRPPKTETDPHRDRFPELGSRETRLRSFLTLVTPRTPLKKAAPTRDGHQGALGPGISGIQGGGRERGGAAWGRGTGEESVS